MNTTLTSFTDILGDEICNSQPLSLSSSVESRPSTSNNPCVDDIRVIERPPKGTGQRGQFRSTEEIDSKYRDVFSYQYFNLVQSSVIEDALYSDKSMVVCAPTGSGKTVVFEMAIVQLLMELEEKQYTEDFKIIYMAPVKALCTERLTEWYAKFTRLGLLCIEVTGDTDVDFTQLKPYKIIITTPEKWDMLTRRWRDHRGLVEVIKLFLIDEVHILNDETRGPVLEAVVSRMKTIENSAQSVHRIEQLQKEIQGQAVSNKSAPSIRFVAVSATVSNPEDVANWLGTSSKPAVFYKFGDECRPVKLKRIVEGYPCSEGTSIFKFDIILNYKLWPIIQKYHSGKPTLIFCNTRKSVILTAETLSRELTINFNAEQKAKLTALASSIKNKKLQALVMSGVGCHHAGLLYEERQGIETAFRNRDLPILITTTTLAMGVNLPAHLVIVKNTQQYVNGAYQEYSISTVLQMVGRAGRPQFDTEATAVIMTRLVDKPRYQALVGGCEPLQSYLHKRLAENLNSEAALGTVGDVAQCVQWLLSTFLYVRAARDPKKYLGLPQNSPQHLISKKIEELCVKAMNGLASSGLITMDEASCIESTEAGRLMSIFYLDLETMKQIMKIEGTESLERLLGLICESHELADMHLRVDERRCLNLLNRNNAAATIRFPMKGKISTRQMKLNCVIQAVLGCLPIPDPSLNQEAMKIMRIADRVCKCLVTYVTRPDLITQQPQFFSAVLNSIVLAKCVAAHLWDNSAFVSKQLKGIGPTFSTLLASAGKVNFMLLEESHPRDLERIMNKGPPAGNVLRKQVSLLPKYQLTMTPVDEKIVTVQLVLLNQSYMAENMENLTAGDSHKSYIIVGDSNNNLLLLVAFKDRDLISVFDGTITHEIRRKHSFEHKVFAHCISSSFVGIDVQSEYIFNGLEPFFGGPAPSTKTLQNSTPVKKTAERQTCITDTFKERKRKINPDAIEKSREKRKRECAIIENFKYLRQSFETATKNVNQNLYQHGKTSKDTLNDKADACSLTNNPTANAPYAVNTNPVRDKLNSVSDQNPCNEIMDSDEFIDDEKIDSILNEIENEMGKSRANLDNAKPNSNPYIGDRNFNIQNPFSFKRTGNSVKDMSNQKLLHYKTVCAPRKRKPTTSKSNYNFIELLERKLSLSDEEEITEVTQKQNGFSDTIKSQIQKYLSKTKAKQTSVPDIKKILDKPEDGLPIDDEKTQVIEPINANSHISDNDMHSPYPRYEIKEILGATDLVEQNSNIQQKKKEETFIYNEHSTDCDIMTNKNIIEMPYKLITVDTSHCDTKTLSPLHNVHTILLDDKDSKNNSDNEVNRNYLDETLIIDYDESDKMPPKKNVQRKVDNVDESNENETICVEDYNFEKDNGCSNYVANLDPDVIMISPKTVTDECSNTNDRDMNDQCSDMNKQYIITKGIVDKESNNNPSYVLLNNNDFQNLYESTKTGALAKNSGTDVVLRNMYQLVESYTPSHDKALVVEDAGRITYESTATDALPEIPCSDIVLKAKNQIVGNNRTSHDETLAIENISRNLYESSKTDDLARNSRIDIVLKNRYHVVDDNRAFNSRNIEFGRAQKCNKSICSQSGLNDPYQSSDLMKSQNISSKSSNNIELNDKKTEYVKRYTYSTNKIDVCTQQTPEYCVQVIKKMKMDLDITTIVSCKQNSSQDNKSNCEETSKNNNGEKIIELPKHANTFQNTTDDNSMTNIITFNNEIRNTSQINLPSVSTSEFSTKKNLAKLPNNAIAKDENATKTVKNEDINEGPKISDFRINKKHTNSDAGEIQSPERIKYGEFEDPDNQNDNFNNTSGESRETEHGNSTVNSDNKLKSILQKYSKILAKNEVKTVTPTNRNVTFNNATTIKRRKPFKITDIHKLHATLPSTILNNKPEVETDILPVPRVNRSLEARKNNEDLNSSGYTQCTRRTHTEEIPKYESITDLDLEPLHLPDNVDLEPSQDYKIDQSMFDPKTLLQCVADDESDEIVPPPPEFCDGIIYSPGYENTEATMVGDRASTRQLDIFTEKDMEYNESIFDNTCATDLSPPTEIETWNLSQEASWEPSNNTNADYNFSQNSGMSRQGKLGIFRFRQKNKLIIKK